MAPQKSSKRRQRKNGFSLLEILIAIALVALLASVTLKQLTGVFGDNQNQAAQLFIDGNLDLALTRYRLDVGNYPTTEEGLNALMRAPAGKEARWKGPYLKEPPVDPWGNPYKYQFPGARNSFGARGYDVWSLGEDGVESSDDITNWSTK
ncbi:MAG: type II secretion system protein GspG [Puniceicoccaceae bacterium]|nr:MAG: type II secretion system protein GspG [Puniceicoccaceae bacterium]